MHAATNRSATYVFRDTKTEATDFHPLLTIDYSLLKKNKEHGLAELESTLSDIIMNELCIRIQLLHRAKPEHQLSFAFSSSLAESSCPHISCQILSSYPLSPSWMHPIAILSRVQVRCQTINLCSTDYRACQWQHAPSC